MKKTLPDKYPSLLTVIADTLDNIISTNIPADKALEQVMRNNKNWENEKRRLVAEAVYDIIRYRRLLDEAAANYFDTKEINYQYLIITWLVFKEYSLPGDGVFKGVSGKLIEEALNKYNSVRKIRESIPNWLDELGEKELGAQWDAVIHALNQKPSSYIRVNTLKKTKEELGVELSKEGINTQIVSWSPDAIEILSSTNIFRTEGFQQGNFEVQDAASQMVARMLDVAPGMRVIDACAGTGGKTLHLASLMKNKGKIIALDNKAWRLDDLKKRTRRAGVDIVETKVLDSTKVTKRLSNTADRLLLDVPCSGLGVLKRNPDIKWKLNEKQLEELKQQQFHILSSYSHMVKAKGKMVYATCSILPSEGEEQIKKFLEGKTDIWLLTSEKRFSPEKDNCDGFYVAVLERLK